VVRDVEEALCVMRSERVDVAVGVPTQLLSLARHDDRLRLKAVLLSTDHVPVALAENLERAWGARVFGHYGMTEMGLGGGVECEARRGYHLREADLYFEIVDPVTGDPVGEGVQGEVVFTTLTRAGMPLVRYRTGDLSRFVPGQCPCGTVLNTLERITMRAAGGVPLGAGLLTMAELDERLFAIDGVLDFAVTVSRRAARDRLMLQVRATEPAAHRVDTAIEAALGSLQVIEEARRSQQLDVAVAVESSNGTMPPPVKRRIRDVRNDA
jgi:phenylacetate-coenzyme A ligase PaaK-like adenylate-forming protein